MTSYQDLALPNGFTLTTWYDHNTRSWITRVLDAEGNQVGNAEYDGHRAGVDFSRKLFFSKYQQEA